jgi:hypothetical protein
MAKTTKTTKAATTKSSTAKTNGAKAAPKSTTKPAAKTAAKASPKTTSKAKAAPKAKSTSKAAGTNPAEKLAKTCQEAAAKFEKMNDDKYTDIKEKLEWCVGSYNHDKNPAGLKEYGEKAVGMLKEAKKDKPRLVSQKLIDDLQTSLSKV